MLREAVDAAFLEDKAMLEGQHSNMKERPDGNRNFADDAGRGSTEQ